MFKILGRRSTPQPGTWWKSFWLSRLKIFLGQEVFHQAQTKIRLQRPTVRPEDKGYRCRVRYDEQVYQIRIEPAAFDEALWKPIMDEMARRPQLIRELLGANNHDMEDVFKQQGGELLVDRALETISCKCGTTRCVHRGMALLAMEQIITESLLSLWRFCGCNLAHIITEMYKRGIDAQGRHEGPDVLAWREQQRAMLHDFWEGKGEPQLPESSRLPAEIPPLPFEMETFMKNVRDMVSKQ
jgi:uncharacterized Zn finger protein